MEQIEMVDFFISYNEEDKAWAEWIAGELEEEKYTTVLQAWDFRPASNFVLEMQKAAENASRTIAVLSPDYLNAVYTQPEWTAAFVQDPTGEKGTLLPVRVHLCELKGMWTPIVYIDLVGLNEAKAKSALLEGVKRGRIKPLTKPGFPGIAQRQIAEQPRFPGASPSIWNVPHQRNQNFTGRVQLMSDLQKALASGPTALTQVIHGLGGVGKTQLALEYIYRNRYKYNIIWWLRSEDSATLASDYAILAQELDLPDKGAADQNLIIAAVRRYLEQQQNWLLVFDNADDPARIKEYIPRGGLGHVIVTSRNPNWRGTASPLSVEVLEREESVDFLVKRTGETDTESASALADALGDLPLALDQAGAYIEAAGISLSSYLDMFNTHKTKLLCRSSPSTDYPYEVATTWNISIDEVRKTCQAGVDLLNLCAFLAPDDIYEELVTDGAKHLPDSLSAAVTDPLIFTDVVRSLRRYSLIEFSGSTISVHRMVRAVVRDQLTTEDKKRWAEAAVWLVADAFPSDSSDVQNWFLCSRLLPHALAATEYAEASDVAASATTRLLNYTGVYLHERGRFAEAKETLERAYGIGNRVLGSEHPSTLTSMNNLAATLSDQGDLDRARKIQEEVLEIRRRILGSEHPDTLIPMNNLAGTLKAHGDLAGARKIQEEVLEITRRIFGEEHPDTLRSMNNLAAILYDQGDLAGARKTHEEVLEISRCVLGSEHPSTLTSMNNLAETLRAQGDLDRARKIQEEVLEIIRRVLGSEHPNTLRSMNGLAATLHEQGDLDGAQDIQEEVLEITRRILGSEHPDTLISMNNLAEILRAQGDLDRARKIQEEVLETIRRMLGREHPSTLTSMNNLAEILRAQGDLDRAREIEEEVLEITRRILGEEHPGTSVSAWNLLTTLVKIDDPVRAITVLETDLFWLLNRDPASLGAAQRRIREQIEEARG